MGRHPQQQRSDNKDKTRHNHPQPHRAIAVKKMYAWGYRHRLSKKKILFSGTLLETSNSATLLCENLNPLADCSRCSGSVTPARIEAHGSHLTHQDLYEENQQCTIQTPFSKTTPKTKTKKKSHYMYNKTFSLFHTTIRHNSVFLSWTSALKNKFPVSSPSSYLSTYGVSCQILCAHVSRNTHLAFH